MKYLVSLAIITFAFMGTAFGQETGAELKNAGNAAYKAKDYKGALENFEKAAEAFKAEGAEDKAVVYNAATCARKIKDNKKALSLYQQCADMGYKGDAAAFYVAKCHKLLGDEDKMEQVIIAALEKYKSSKYLSHMKKLVVTYYLKQGKIPFDKGVQILNSRTDSNRDKWGSIKETAVVEFEKSKLFVNKALEFDAENESAKSILSTIDASLKN